MASKRYALVDQHCVSCGCCIKVCPRSAISIWKGVIAQVNQTLCVGCGRCAAECPAGAITLNEREVQK